MEVTSQNDFAGFALSAFAVSAAVVALSRKARDLRSKHVEAFSLALLMQKLIGHSLSFALLERAAHLGGSVGPIMPQFLQMAQADVYLYSSQGLKKESRFEFVWRSPKLPFPQLT